MFNYCFSISNIPTYILSQTKHPTFVNKTTPLNIVRNELKSKVYFYAYNGLFLNQNLFNSMNYVKSVLFKIFHNDIENIKSLRLCLALGWFDRHLCHSLHAVFSKVRNLYQTVQISHANKYVYERDVVIVMDLSGRIRCHSSPVFVFGRTWTNYMFTRSWNEMWRILLSFCSDTKFNETSVIIPFLFFIANCM